MTASAFDRPDGDLCDRAPGVYSSLDTLPAGWLDLAEHADQPLRPSWHPLLWPSRGDATRLCGAVDTTGWTPLLSTDRRLLEALRLRQQLRPRPQLQFGDRLVGAGDAWLAVELPAPAGKQLYAVQTTPLPAGRLRFDLTVHGSRPPVTALCTSLDAVVDYTAPWRFAAARDGRFELMVSAQESLARD